jgi:hypothetical protein
MSIDTMAPRRRTRAILLAGTILLAAAAGALLLAGCAAQKVSVSSFSQVGRGQVVLVGRIELVPPLKPEEQNFMATATVDKNTAFVITDKKMRPPVDLTAGQTDYEGYFEATFGETFYIKNPNHSLYLIQNAFYLELSGTSNEIVYLPGGAVVEVQPGDKAVYMGTLRYHRNEYFDISRIEIIDDYAREKKAFERKFGTDHPLVKRLLKPVKS